MSNPSSASLAVTPPVLNNNRRMTFKEVDRRENKNVEQLSHNASLTLEEKAEVARQFVRQVRRRSVVDCPLYNFMFPVVDTSL